MMSSSIMNSWLHKSTISSAGMRQEKFSGQRRFNAKRLEDEWKQSPCMEMEVTNQQALRFKHARLSRT